MYRIRSSVETNLKEKKWKSGQKLQFTFKAENKSFSIFFVKLGFVSEASNAKSKANNMLIKHGAQKI